MTNKKNNQGFKEDIDSLTGKRLLHCIAAEKGKFKKENVSKASAIVPVPDKEDIITLRYENSDEFTKLAEEFEEDNNVELGINNEGEDIIVNVPIEQSADFIEFMEENGIKEKENTEETMDDVKNTEKADEVKSTEKIKSVDSSLVDKIIAEATSKRSRRAINKDKTRTAKRVGNKRITGDLISWLKNPGKSDLQGVDTAETE